MGFERVTPDGQREAVERELAEEVPIAIEVNGFGYAVMMATPADLEDFGVGFLLSERLMDGIDDLIDCDAHVVEHGAILRLTVAARVANRVMDRVRHRTTDSSCGLCGVENLEAALRPLPVVTSTSSAQPAAIFHALEALGGAQPLNARTGAVHAAARCDEVGRVTLVREDVGRHNAFDKLIGAMARQGLGWDGGFALLSSRCSFELVEKAALANCPLLVAISAPTALAAERAQAAGLKLVALARADALLALS